MYDRLAPSGSSSSVKRSPTKVSKSAVVAAAAAAAVAAAAAGGVVAGKMSAAEEMVRIVYILNSSIGCIGMMMVYYGQLNHVLLSLI